jgi:hypothetical protein
LGAIKGNLGSAHITAKGVRRAGTRVDVTATLQHITPAGTTSGGSATATIPYAELQKRLDRQGGHDFAVAGSDRGLALTETVGTMNVPVTVYNTVTVSHGKLTVTPADVSILGRDAPVSSLTAMLGSAVAGKLAPRSFPLPEFPRGVSVTGADATPGGLALDFTVAPTDGKAATEAGGVCGAGGTATA